MQITGYDISSSTLPQREYWPANVSFSTLDCLNEQLPEDLVGIFDIVHLRMWALIVRDNDPGALIRNADRLLKPGGYLQWEDAPFKNVVACGEAAIHVRDMMRAINCVTKIDFSWLENLETHIQIATSSPSLQVIDHQKTPWAPYLIPLCMNTFMLALESSGSMLDKLRLLAPDPQVVPSQAE
ncbi:class I SAM-dependent methyltransferase [Aspergillus stella-maris]|uniref:class I SAM-dependent methyltransferase n=1 Tax=Aspergillus stella-maris TaxID=1810926 RepID=UPI003CCC97B2